MSLVPPDGGKRVEAVGGEDVEGGDAAEVTPVLAIGGGPQGCVVVEDVFSGEEAGAVGEDDVVFGEAFLE